MMKRNHQTAWVLLVFVAWAWSVVRPVSAEDAASVDRTSAIRGSFATYNAAPRGKDGRVDIPCLIAELVELKANTYHWLIGHSPTDWDDLQAFLPVAREKGIRVWACLLPPSESPPKGKHFSEPFQLDFERWAVEFAKLGVKEPNFVAWSVDDFTHNLTCFTPERMKKILGPAREINPKLAFVPCTYFPKVTPQFAEQYRGFIDGLLFPYRHESVAANLTDAGLVEEEVRKLKAIVGPSVPVIVDVYATAHSRLGPSTPDYVREVMTSAHRCADGVHVYCHQKPDSEKYPIIKELFNDWAKDAPSEPAKPQ
jgi:hypothetical protein